MAVGTMCVKELQLSPHLALWGQGQAQAFSLPRSSSYSPAFAFRGPVKLRVPTSLSGEAAQRSRAEARNGYSGSRGEAGARALGSQASLRSTARKLD